MQERTLLLLTLFLSFIITIGCFSQTTDRYICPPCDRSCDLLLFDKNGICPHCKMELVKVNHKDIPKVNEVKILKGKGFFLIEGGQEKEEKIIKVAYYMPEVYDDHSKILIVIPGAGRNAESYRNVWIEYAEENNTLILSLMYSELSYGFDDYHLCGLINHSNAMQSFERKKGTNHAVLDEGKLNFQTVINENQWIFSDFDRLFEIVVNSLNSNLKTYDIFGHSAGAQILHRMTMFYPESKARRIIAANSGFYTLPERETAMPFGTKGYSQVESNISLAFSKKLTILVGELDNASEQKGTLLRSVTADRQGLHRNERGRYFYNFSKEMADQMGYTFNWQFQEVPNVGHDNGKMANAASRILKN